MNTREEYPRGCLVVATARFREQFFMSDVATGIVVGHSRDGQCIRVRRDGYRSIGTFHWHYWDRVVATSKVPTACSRCPAFIWAPESVQTGLCAGCRSPAPQTNVTG